jgi:hypothetical protein
MGLIDGAIIGGAIGMAVGGYMAWQMAAWQKKLVAAVDAGDFATAERLVAKHAAPTRAGKAFPMAKLLQQRHRVIGQWFLGKPDEVRHELAMHAGSGGAAYLLNVHLMGLVAQATDTAAAGGDASALVREIQDTAERVGKETNALQKLLRDYATMIAKVAPGFAGERVDEADAQKLLGKSHSESLLTKILLLRALVVVAERAGKPASFLNQKLAQVTRRFTPGAGAQA